MPEPIPTRERIRALFVELSWLLRAIHKSPLKPGPATEPGEGDDSESLAKARLDRLVERVQVELSRVLNELEPFLADAPDEAVVTRVTLDAAATLQDLRTDAEATSASIRYSLE